jgi:hypothetical protein
MIKKIIMSGLILCMAACTAVMYEGRKRPDSAVATIELIDTVVVMIDGKEVPLGGRNYSTIKILPGQHTATIKLNDKSHPNGVMISIKGVTVKFRAEAGQTYITRPRYNEANRSQWCPEIVSKNTNERVSNPCLGFFFD